MTHNGKARALLPDVKRMSCGILGLSPDHTGPLVYYSDAALAIKAALTSREPAYDRELIARMLTEYNAGLIGQFSPVAVEHQIKLLREAENHSAEGVGTACIRAQRDELATANERLAARIAAEAAPPAAGGVSEEQVRDSQPGRGGLPAR